MTTITSTTQSTSDSASTATKAQKGIADDMNSFLLLLTTQLKNQDPTSPMDTAQMTQQLVGFAGVQQQVNANLNLESLIKLQQANQKDQSVSYIGKLVDIEGSAIQTDGTHGAGFSYNLASPAKNMTLSVTSSSGNVIYSQVLSDPKTGLQYTTWDGKDNNGNLVAAGTYNIKATAVDANGNSVPVTTQVSGYVSSVDLSEDTPQLVIGGVKIPLDKVKSVSGVSTSQTTTN